MYDLLVRTETYMRIAIDIAAFCSGHKFLIIVDTFTDPAGKTHNVNLEDKELSTLSTICSSASNFEAIFKLIAADTKQVFALNDLIETMAEPLNRTVHAARAVETLRNLLSPSEPDKKKGWRRLHEKLNVSETYVRSVVEPSTSVRHGDHLNRPKASVSREIQKRAWILMNRYLEYKLRGNGVLPIDSFPLL